LALSLAADFNMPAGATHQKAITAGADCEFAHCHDDLFYWGQFSGDGNYVPLLPDIEIRQ
jgi:hypothetical protein